jgi:hypothetical protein
MLQILTADHVHAHRQKPQLFELTDRDRTWNPGLPADRLLRYLLRWRYATAPMLAHAYQTLHGTGAYGVRNELTRMHRHQLVTRYWQPTFAGAAPHIYVASTLGAQRVIAAKDWPLLAKPITNRAARPEANLAHPLGLSLLQMLWELGTEGHDRWRTVGYHTDRSLTLTVRVDGKPVRLVPDAVVLVQHLQPSYYRPVFLELDLAHKSGDRLRQRAQAYRELLGSQQHVASGLLHRIHNVPVMNGTALFLAPTRNAADRLRATTQEALAVGTLFGSKRPPDAWFLSLDRIVETSGAILPPRDLFAAHLATNLAGKVGRILP